MKKAANSTPNQRLKVERELRGWSQKYVAGNYDLANEVGEGYLRQQQSDHA